MDDQQGPEFLQPFQIEFSVAALFDKHVETLKESKRQRREALQIKSVAASSSLAASGVAAAGDMGEVRPTDKFAGDAALRTLYRLLALIDDRGFARSSQQLTFHNSFTRATARVIFRDDWSRAQPQIQEMNNWESCPSEVLVSTPRRFGKTFSIAKIVIFSKFNPDRTRVPCLQAQTRADSAYIRTPQVQHVARRASSSSASGSE